MIKTGREILNIGGGVGVGMDFIMLKLDPLFIVSLYRGSPIEDASIANRTKHRPEIGSLQCYSFFQCSCCTKQSMQIPCKLWNKTYFIYIETKMWEETDES